MKIIKVATALILLLPMLASGQTVTVTPGSAAAYIFSPATASAITTCPVCSSSQGTWKLNLADASILNPGTFTRANIRAVRWTGWGNFLPTTAGATSGKFTGIILREPCEAKAPPTTGGPVTVVENCTYASGGTKTGFVKCPEGILFSSGARGSGYCAYAYGAATFAWWGWFASEYAYAVQVDGIDVDNVIDSP